MDEKLGKACIQLADIAFKFAATNRVTLWPDCETPESDTDHTVMLGLVACSVAHTYAPHLDVGKIAQFALVHDLVEAYAGDTNTFGGLSENAILEKEEREQAALKRIERELEDSLPWVPTMIREYESLASPEARFIKVLDKAMPKLTRLLNKQTHTTKAEFDAFCEHQIEKMRTSYAHDQDEALQLYLLLATEVSLLLEELESLT